MVGVSGRFAAASAVLVSLAAGCSSSPEQEPFTCAIGSLTGTWLVKYSETNGSCGPFDDETIVMESAGSDPLNKECTFAANRIATDKCSMEQDFTCPTRDREGTGRWIGITRQRGAGRLEGTMTLQIQHPRLGACRSTYAIVWTKQ